MPRKTPTPVKSRMFVRSQKAWGGGGCVDGTSDCEPLALRRLSGSFPLVATAAGLRRQGLSECNWQGAE